jgi:hypothetical protein
LEKILGVNSLQQVPLQDTTLQTLLFLLDYTFKKLFDILETLVNMADMLEGMKGESITQRGKRKRVEGDS